MKKLKAFWMKRDIATRLTAVAAVMLISLATVLLFYGWRITREHYEAQQFNLCIQNSSNVGNLMQQAGYTSSKDMPAVGSDEYWLLRERLYKAGYSDPDFPVALSIYDPQSTSYYYMPPLFTLIAEDSTHTTFQVDIGHFSEDDIRMLRELANGQALTAYGVRTQNGVFFPNLIVSHGGQVYRSAIPIEERDQCSIIGSYAFEDAIVENQLFSRAFLQNLHPSNTSDILLAPNTVGYCHSYGAFYVLSATTINATAATLSRMGGTLALTLVLLVLFIWLLHRQIRRTVTQPLWETTRQARLVSTLQFDEFHPDTARGDEIGQLNRALRDMAGDLHARWDSERDLEDKRQQFVAAASHDLKTPLALIGGYAEAIAQDISPEENARYLAAIEQETARMNELVREMLDYTRLDRTDELQNRKTVDLTALVRSLLDEYAPLFESRRLTSNIADGVRIRGDGTLLRRAFGCLLENAAKYSPDGGRISVTLRQAQNALLTVENDCEPIPEEELSRLFEMFYRGDKARSRAGGHGLGLTITRRILALHHLSCRAENTKNGVRFTVSAQ